MTIRNRDRGWGCPVPIYGLVAGHRCGRLFRDFFPVDDLNPVEPEDLDAILQRVFSGSMPDYTCVLSKEWLFEEITEDAARRLGYEFDGRRHGSIAEIILKALHDLERSVLRYHPNASCEALAKFWTSWNLQRHLAELDERIQRSRVALLMSREPWRDTRAARELMNVQLAVYAHEIRPLKSLRTEQPYVEGKPSEDPCKRKGEIDAFLQRCKELSVTRVLRRHIWLLVGHSKGRQFEYWQACDKKATREDEINFSRVLRMEPEEFIALLRQKHLIPSA